MKIKNRVTKLVCSEGGGSVSVFIKTQEFVKLEDALCTSSTWQGICAEVLLLLIQRKGISVMEGVYYMTSDGEADITQQL